MLKEATLVGESKLGRSHCPNSLNNYMYMFLKNIKLQMILKGFGP